MQSIDNKVDTLFKMLFAPYKELRNIDNKLLLLALTQRGEKLGKPLRDALKQEYGMENYQRLETLGDAVLELVVMEKLFHKRGVIMGLASKIVNNKSLYCFMWRKKYCDLLISSFQHYKDCADVFESILGAIYIHVQSTVNNPIHFIALWLDDQFDFSAVIDYIINHQNEENVCYALTQIPLSSVSPSVSPSLSSSLLPTLSPSLSPSGVSPSSLQSLLSQTPNDELSHLTVNELKNKNASIQREIASRVSISFKTKLDNYYMKHNLTRPIDYKVIKVRPYQVSISCPSNLSCNQSTWIGVGEGTTLKEAEERAAESALIFYKP